MANSLLKKQAVPKGSRARKRSQRTAILIAALVHGVIILIASAFVILPARKDKAELTVTVVTTDSSVKMTRSKKSVEKMLKRSPPSVSAAARMADLLTVDAVAKYTAPDVKRSFEGPVGMGEADLGKGAFGLGTGMDGTSNGREFFGEKTQGNLAVIFDVSASMYKPNPVVIREIKSTFRGAQVVGVFSGGFTRGDGAFIPYASNQVLLEKVRENGKQDHLRATRDAMNKALFSLQRCDSIDGRQSLGYALELLLKQERKPGTVYIFSDFHDKLDRAYMKNVQNLVKQTGTKVILWNPRYWNKNRSAFQTFARECRAEIKTGSLHPQK